MATQTIERNKELEEASMTTLVAPSQSNTRTVYSEDPSTQSGIILGLDVWRDPIQVKTHLMPNLVIS